MEIHSPAFEHNRPIPVKFTCQGEDVSPPLEFRQVPKGAKSLALIVEDPDAPGKTFVHWVVWNIDPAAKGLKEGASVPVEGTNHFREVNYRGPCPPKGSSHRYFFKLYALDVQLNLPSGSSREELEKAMQGHKIGEAEMVGTYQRM